MKCFPDFQLFTVSLNPLSRMVARSEYISQIFDESPDSSGQGLTQNALITVHASMRVNVDLNDPGKPESDRVNKGYNEDLDRPRPNSMDNLLELRKFTSSLSGVDITFPPQKISSGIPGG